MPFASINLTPQNGPESVTAINCGSSNPRLGGTIDISAFSNLQNFTCSNNGITWISGISNLSALTLIDISRNSLTTFPSLSANTALQYFYCYNNALTGSIPSLSANTALVNFYCYNNRGLNGELPSLSANTALQRFHCYSCSFTGSLPVLPSSVMQFRCEDNQLTGSIPNFTSNKKLNAYFCHKNQLVGNIPDLAALQSLNQFVCNNNNLSGFSGGVPTGPGFGRFEAHNNSLTQSAVDAILAAFVDANRIVGGTLLLNGTDNSAPSSEGVSTTTLAGTAFSRSDSLVTVTSAAHGYNTDDWVTVTGINQTAFQGTFSVTRISDNIFQYSTVSSGTLTGTGTATLRKTSTGNTSGFRNFQALALVSRIGGPWTIAINFPT